MIVSDIERELSEFLRGGSKTLSRPLVVGKPSEILVKCGANRDHNITITKKVIDKAMRVEKRNEQGRLVGLNGHGLTKEMIVESLKELDNPMLIFKGRTEGSLLIITDITDSKNRNIVIAIEINRQESFDRVNSIRSIYGRDNWAYFIDENFEEGNLLAANRKKADNMLRSIGKSYPKENTFISFK